MGAGSNAKVPRGRIELVHIPIVLPWGLEEGRAWGTVALQGPRRDH